MERDYAKEFTFEELIDILTHLGISANYSEPLNREQVKRLGEKQCRKIYNNIKNTNNLVNISSVKGKDLDIRDTDKYDYVLTYSFPCQDLSKAGKGKGMARDSGTRSGLLWEVERILDECAELGNLPQILLMENVPDVIGTNNLPHFREWRDKLESMGYKCYWQVLNSKDYAIPQNRERCFMISILGDYYYTFPQGYPLINKLTDVLEKVVDEKYYLSKKGLIYAFDCNRVCDNTKRGDLGDRKVTLVLQRLLVVGEQKVKEPMLQTLL
jgi:DNA (cytosine-5)-methyltransferase 1